MYVYIYKITIQIKIYFIEVGFSLSKKIVFFASMKAL